MLLNIYFSLIPTLTYSFSPFLEEGVESLQCSVSDSWLSEIVQKHIMIKGIQYC